MANSTNTNIPLSLPCSEHTNQDQEEGLFEGCGREGPILAIFLAFFHPTVGPKIVYQYPFETISKEIFDTVSSYIIPKTHLQRITMTVNVLGKKIIGGITPVEWEEELTIMFKTILVGLNNTNRECFYIFKDRLLALKVVPAVLADPPKIEDHFVPVFVIDIGPVDKWDLTTQQIIPYVDGFNHVAQLSQLSDVHINLVKSCVQNLLYYNVVKLVPAFQYGNSYYLTPNFHTKLVRGDDNFKNECLFFVAKTDHIKPNFVDVMRFFGAIKRGVTMKELCLRFKNVAAQPALRIINLDSSKFSTSKYSDHSLSSSLQSRNSSNPTTPVKGVDEPLIRTFTKRPSGDKFQPVLSVIDERRLILFGLVHNLIRRVEKYPLFDPTEIEPSHMRGVPTYGSPHRNCIEFGTGFNELGVYWEKHRKKHAAIYEMLDGQNSYDKICLVNEVSQNQLDEIIERDPDVYVTWK